jgi:hypothetical protein
MEESHHNRLQAYKQDTKKEISFSGEYKYRCNKTARGATSRISVQNTNAKHRIQTTWDQDTMTTTSADYWPWRKQKRRVKEDITVLNVDGLYTNASY